MADVTFTANLRRHVDCPDARVAGGADLASALDELFSRHAPAARSYVLDEQGALRTHMTIFINGVTVRDRRTLSDPVPADAQIYIMQALSGG